MDNSTLQQLLEKVREKALAADQQGDEGLYDELRQTLKALNSWQAEGQPGPLPHTHKLITWEIPLEGVLPPAPAEVQTAWAAVQSLAAGGQPQQALKELDKLAPQIEGTQLQLEAYGWRPQLEAQAAEKAAAALDSARQHYLQYPEYVKKQVELWQAVLALDPHHEEALQQVKKFQTPQNSSVSASSLPPTQKLTWSRAEFLAAGGVVFLLLIFVIGMQQFSQNQITPLATQVGVVSLLLSPTTTPTPTRTPTLTATPTLTPSSTPIPPTPLLVVALAETPGIPSVTLPTLEDLNETLMATGVPTPELADLDNDYSWPKQYVLTITDGGEFKNDSEQGVVVVERNSQPYPLMWSILGANNEIIKTGYLAEQNLSPTKLAIAGEESRKWFVNLAEGEYSLLWSAGGQVLVRQQVNWNRPLVIEPFNGRVRNLPIWFVSGNDISFSGRLTIYGYVCVISPNDPLLYTYFLAVTTEDEPEKIYWISNQSISINDRLLREFGTFAECQERALNATATPFPTSTASP